MAASGGSIPATPQMIAVRPNTREWIREWINSFDEDIVADSENISANLFANGFTSRRSLRNLVDMNTGELVKVLGLPYGVVAELKTEAQYMHVRTPAMGNLDGSNGGGFGFGAGGGAAPRAWEQFKAALKAQGVGSGAMATASREATKTYMRQLAYYVASQDSTTAVAVREFMAKPSCSSEEFAELELKVGPHESVQLAAQIMQTLEPGLQEFVEAKAGLQAGGMQILKALYIPFTDVHADEMYQDELKHLKSAKYIMDKADVYMEMETWSKSYKELDANPAELPASSDMKKHILTRVSKLGLEVDLRVEQRMAELGGKAWDAKAINGYLLKESIKWLSIPKTHAGLPKPPYPKQPQAPTSTTGGRLLLFS